MSNEKQEQHQEEEPLVEKSITVDEFYEFILGKMSAEQALKLLLSSSIVSYEKLKFVDDTRAVHPIMIIAFAAMDLGWNFAIEKNQENVRGMVIGTEEYFNDNNLNKIE